MPKPKPFKYHVRPVAPPDLHLGPHVIRTGEHEQLTGIVQGMKASDLEERWSRAIEKLNVNYEFRVRISSIATGAKQHLQRKFTNVEGEVEIDHLCDFYGRVTPIMIDGMISHFMTPYQADSDRLKKDIVDEFGKSYG